MALQTSMNDKIELSISFIVKKIGLLKVNGIVSKVNGDIVFKEHELENSNFNVSLNASSLNTGNAKRDEHLKSKDFLNTTEYSRISFRSAEIKKGENDFLALGRLTILNLTKDIKIPFKNINGILIGHLNINRFDYGVGKKFTSFVAGKMVQISINYKF